MGSARDHSNIIFDCDPYRLFFRGLNQPAPVQSDSMSHRRLCTFRVSIAVRLRGINDPAHLTLLLVRQVNIP